METKLNVEQAKTVDLLPYAHNAKENPEWQVDQIAASIEQFGFNDPIGVWTNPDGQLEIVEGHGRVLAAKALGIEQLPIIRLDHLDDEGRRAYTHVHNRATEATQSDWAVLQEEMAAMPQFDWDGLGFNFREFSEYVDTEEKDEDEAQPIRERFGYVPFSIIQTTDATWRERKAAWISLGIRSEEGREAGLAYQQGLLNRSADYRAVK